MPAPTVFSCPELLSVTEAAKALRVSIPTIWRLILSRELPSVKIRRRRFVLRDDLERFLQEAREVADD